MTLFKETLNGKETKNLSNRRNAGLNGASNVSQAEAIQGWLIDKLAEVLELEPNQIDVGQNFEEYGLESAEAINLSGDLEDYLGCRLPPTLLWDYQNIEALAEYLATQPEHNSSNNSSNGLDVVSTLPELDLTDLNGVDGLDRNLGSEEPTVVEGRELINFATYNYIGMCGDRKVDEKAQNAISRY